MSQQCACLSPLIGDGRAFGIVLIVRGDQLGTLNDGGDDSLKRCNLTGCPRLLGRDDRQEALDVAFHPDESASPSVHRNRRRRVPTASLKKALGAMCRVDTPGVLDYM